VDSDRLVDYGSDEVLPEASNQGSGLRNPISDYGNLYSNPAPDTIDINDLVDEVAGIEHEKRCAVDSSDETFEPLNLTEILITREPYPKQNWKPSRKVRENQLHNSELPTLNTLTTDTIEGYSIPIGKPTDPKDMFEAMRSSDWPKWTVAIDKEYQGLLANKTWDVVVLDDILARHQIISCK